MMGVLRVTLYTKPGCGLCDEALEMLADLARTVPHEVHQMNIADDPALFEAFWDRIPVVQVAEVRLEAPLDEETLLAALRRAAQREGS